MHVDVPLFQHHLLKRLFFLPLIVPLSKISRLYCVGLFLALYASVPSIPRIDLGQWCHLDYCGLTASLKVQLCPSPAVLWWFSRVSPSLNFHGFPQAKPPFLTQGWSFSQASLELGAGVCAQGVSYFAFLRISPLKNTPFFCSATPK